MKNFERKDKKERRRILLSKNNELSYSFDNEKLLQENEAVRSNGLGVMTKLGSLTRKQLRAIIAIIVAVCVIVPSMVFVGLRGKADMNYNENPRYAPRQGTNIAELETHKQVTINNDGTYTIDLEAYQTAQALTQPNLDIIMLLDVSLRMNEVL